MGARTQLNVVNINAGLFVGAVVGALTGSWLVFFMTSAIVIAGGVYTGDIRLDGKKPPRR